MPANRNRMEKFDFAEARRLLAAEGWLELGDWQEAEAEVNALAAEKQSWPEILCLRFQIAAKAGQWERAVELAKAVAGKSPEDPFGWVHWAYALHELKRTQEAYERVLAVVPHFPQEATMHYNLACYSCQLGRQEEAMEWLRRAIRLDKHAKLREAALEDKDLEPLWKEIAGMNDKGKVR